MGTGTGERPPLEGEGHGQLAELLPEYALGLLPERELAALERHLGECPACRRELNELTDAVDLLAFAAPPARPRPEVKAALLARLPAPSFVAPPPHGARAVGSGVGRRRVVSRLLAAAAVAAILALLAWNLALQRQLDDARRQLAEGAEDRQIARLLRSPTAAHALTESELTPRPVGYVYAESESPIGLMLAYRMPPLRPDQRYQIWLIKPDGTRDSGGLFAVDEKGNGSTVIYAPGPFGNYRSIGITAERWEGSASPSGPRVVGGPLQ